MEWRSQLAQYWSVTKDWSEMKWAGATLAIGTCLIIVAVIVIVLVRCLGGWITIAVLLSSPLLGWAGVRLFRRMKAARAARAEEQARNSKLEAQVLRQSSRTPVRPARASLPPTIPSQDHAAEVFDLAPESRKVCPHCGEEILAVAKKCKHCGEWLVRIPTMQHVQTQQFQPVGVSPLATCPHCGSHQIQILKKGYKAGTGCCFAILLGPLGLLCGFAGANTVSNVCVACGHQWLPPTLSNLVGTIVQLIFWGTMLYILLFVF